MSASDNDNSITELRKILFETMRGVKDGSIDLDRAKTVSDLGQTIINTAKAEIDGLRVIGGSGTGFIPAFPALPPKRPSVAPQEQTPGQIVHKCK